MKYLLTSLLFIACAVVSRAQMLDPMLSSLMSENAKSASRVKKLRAQGVKPQMIKPDIDTMAIKQNMEVSFNENGTVRSVIVIAELADGAGLPTDELECLGIDVSMHSGSFAILTVPGEVLDKLAQVKAFSNLYASGIRKLSNDKAREATSVSYVTGEKECNQIPSKYNGEGVVVGVIDLGIDFNHAAFIDPKTGQTRIKEAVYFEGQTMKVVSDAEAIATLHAIGTQTSHGSHTSATAAGSNVAGYQGMAPGAELVLCDLGSSLADSRIISSIEEIFRYADSVGKPAVINMSLGSNLGYHDGSEDITKFVKEKVGEGKIVCISAGNEGADKLSVVKTLGDTDADGYQLKTVCASNKATEDGGASFANGLKVLIYANDTQDIDVELKAIDVTTGTLYSLDVKPLYNADTGEKVNMDVEVKKDSKTYCYINKGKAYFKESNLQVAILVKGKEGQTITIISDDLDLCGAETYPLLADYEEGNPDMSINTLVCDDAVLSVGSYVHRRAFNSIDGYSYYSSTNNQVDKIAAYSSYGVDDNGVPRPDILTPGLWMVSAYNLYDTSTFTNQSLDEKTGNYKMITKWFTPEELGANYTRPSAYGAMTGTSMACPVATGIVALWLQANPRLTPADVRKIARHACLSDKWTSDASNIPSGSLVQAGMGKLDALRGIKYIENQKAGKEVCQLDETITFQNGIATYSSDKALDFRVSTAPKAYVASSYENGVLNLTRAEIVPAGTGLMLLDKEDGRSTFTVPIAPSAPTVKSNYFVGTADSPVTLAREGEGYVLSKFNNVIGFYQNAGGLIVPKNKAYLVLPDDGNGANEVKDFRFVLEGSDDENPIDGEDYIEIPDDDLQLHPFEIIHDEPDGISSVKANGKESSFTYNILGQRVSSSYRGIIIKNGRKYIQL